MREKLKRICSLAAKSKIRMEIHRYGAVFLTALLLVYYCMNRELYSAEGEIGLLQSVRTYVVMGICLLLIALELMTNSLSEQRNRLLSWIWFALAPFAVYFSLYYLNAEKFQIHFWSLNKIALLLTFAFLFLVQGLLFCLTGSIRWAVVICAVAVAALGILNRFVISFRAMAISAADLFSVGTAMTVASDYSYRLNWHMYMELLLTLAICVVSLKLRGGRMLRPVGRAAMLLLCLIFSYRYYYVCCRTDFLEEHDIRSQGFTHQLRYKEYDMLFTTLCTCFYLAAEKPEGYSAEAAERIAQAYESDTAAASDTPDLIVIMNESFADFESIGRGLTLSEDAMPFIHSLTENTIKGTAYASVFGGNTPNSEYEFLTGNTMAFLPQSSVGFNLFVRGEMPSLASQLGSQGYDTMAIHPYRGSNYRRNIVYPQLGFDTYYTRDDFEAPAYIRKYISDDCLADRIIEEYEAKKGGEDSEQPFFCYNVTIQNHGDYTMSNAANIDFQITVQEEEVNRTKAEIYVNLIRESDAVFQKLTEYFAQQEKPVVLLMFGDHQPNLGDDTYEYLLGTDTTQEEGMEKYKVPFVIWANYDIPEETIERTSLNYLYSILADRLGLSMTGYQKYLLELSEQIPVINTLGYWGADGNFYELDDQSSPYAEKINEYHILEYNYIFGKNDRNSSFLELK